MRSCKFFPCVRKRNFKQWGSTTNINKMNDYIPPQMMCEIKIEYAGGAGILLVNDCCLTPIQQFSALSWQEEDNFQ